MKELPKAYIPKDYEDTIYKQWENSGFFNPDNCKIAEDADTFSIVLPPPNVTGTLHMGHAMMLALEDVMVRYHRMKGDRTLWVPGTDHAAVATESKVEKLLIDEGMEKPKQELGKEKFLERVRQFAQESHDTIVNQSKKMGSSLDWSREAFTLDEKRNFAVRTVFKKMYDDGLIYRGYRVINWSVKGQSTCSDDELVHVERQGKLYYFKYAKDFPITIATTRPETKLGDTAVAVHPEDKRYKQYIGQTFTVDVGAKKPLELKVIADEDIDPEYGTGALGVTPAHSKVDFEMYTREKAKGNDIGLIQVIGEDGLMTKEAGKVYAGLTVKEARNKFVAYLKENDLLESEEDVTQNVGTSDRFKDVVEPLPKTQWFVNVNKKFVLAHSNLTGIKSGEEVTLKQLMQTVVKKKQIEIIPARFNKTYFNWIDNLRDWCISRQIWYGHQIPVWYKGDEIYCDIEPPEGDGWIQDPDTLDTWFSSGLWTFSTLGWPTFAHSATAGRPGQKNDFANFHPTSVLETGYDILFFWVARMILMTTYTLGEIPFEKVYLHGLVRDEQGRKMSKSIGNIINPLDMIEKYGTDATRLSLLVGATPGNDMKLSEAKVAGYRNFTNKLWNISRFILMNIDEPNINVALPKDNLRFEDLWILGRLNDVIRDVTEHIEAYKFSPAGELLRNFTWNDLADWYVEIAKVHGQNQKVLNYILNTVLKLWHPYMPFVTETIWKEVYGVEAVLMVEKWPKAIDEKTNMDLLVKLRGSESLILHFQNLVASIRIVKNQYKIGKVSHGVFVPSQTVENLEDFVPHVGFLAGIEKFEIKEVFEPTDDFVSQPVGAIGTVHVLVGDQIDKTAEKIRLQKELDHVEPYIGQMEKKLSNKGFVDNAPKEVLAQEQQKLNEAKQKIEALKKQIEALKK